MKLRSVCNLCNNKKLITKYSFDDYSILQCSRCSFIYRDRILSHKEEESLYDKDYYLKLQKEYFINCLTPNPRDQSRINDFKSRISLLKKHLKNKTNIKLLDIGAGTGAFGFLCEKEGWQTLNVEISPFAARVARNKFKVKTYVGEVTDSRFKEGNFDVITLWESIANIEDSSKLLKHVHTILKKDGKIAILTTVIDSWLYDVAEVIRKLSFGKVTYFVKEGYPIHHANHFTRINLNKLFKENQFKIIHISNKEIPYKYTKLPKYFLPLLLIFGRIANLFSRTIQVLLIAEKV